MIWIKIMNRFTRVKKVRLPFFQIVFSLVCVCVFYCISTLIKHPLQFILLYVLYVRA